MATQNILIMSVDDMFNVVRYREAFGVEISTPNIDRLMNMGTTFSNAMSTTPICSPARASVVTSLSGFTTGVYTNKDNIQDLVDVNDTIFGQAHADGFYTWSQGKLVHRHDAKSEWFGDAFDYYEEGGERPDKGDGPILAQIEPMDILPRDHIDRATVNAAADFLTNSNGDPFAMFVGLHNPHTPWRVPDKFYDLYPVEDIVLPDALTWDDLPDIFKNVISSHGKADQDGVIARGEWAEAIQAYFAAISFADHNVGKILDALDESGHWDDTSVVFFSDHGYHLGDRGIWRKFTLWEEAASIPLIIADPSVERGVVDTTPASLLDIWPTVSGLTDLTAPAETDGVNLTTDHGREGVITTVYGSMSYRTSEYRYTLYEDGTEELFTADDLTLAAPVADPDPTILSNLRAALLADMSDLYGVDVVTDGIAQGSGGADILSIIGASTEARGHRGADILWGWSADNDLRGGRGRDGLFGGSGDDMLLGGRGRDKITGGDGADTFLFSVGKDRVLDYEPGADVVDTKGHSYTLHQYDNGNACINWDDAGKMIVIDTDVSDLDLI